MSVFRGERVGLVGPNGSGKSSIFRLIVGEDQPDGGNVVVDKGVTIGYFSQTVGDMNGRTVVEETMAGAGEGMMTSPPGPLTQVACLLNPTGTFGASRPASAMCSA